MYHHDLISNPCQLYFLIIDNSSGPALFPFGVAADDQPGPRGDDSASNRVTLEVPFTFIGTEYSRIVVRICVCMQHIDTIFHVDGESCIMGMFIFNLAAFQEYSIEVNGPVASLHVATLHM